MKLITRSPLVFRLLRVAAWLCARFRASCLASSPVLSPSLVDVAADPKGRDLAGSSPRLGSEWIGSRFGPAAAVTDAPLSPSSGALEVLANPWRTPDQLLAGEPIICSSCGPDQLYCPCLMHLRCCAGENNI